MSHRRRTLATLTVNDRSSVGPTSGSTAKPTMGPSKRLSLAPSINKRRSLAPSSRLDQKAKENKTTTTKRKSIGGRRRSSMYGGQTSSAKLSDPRPIGDKAYTQQMIRTLVTFLSEHDYDRPISPKLLNAPTTKEFRFLLTFLFTQIDPNFAWGDNFEDEVRVFLKKFGYPFNVSKSSLIAVGSPHAWPSLLAVLVWLIEFITYDEFVENEAENDVTDESGRIFYNYCANAYSDFLAGVDDYGELDDELAATYESKNKNVKEETSKFEEKNRLLQEEIDALNKAQNELSDLQVRRTNYFTDLDKFAKLIAQTKQHKTMLERQLKDRESESKSISQELLETQNEETRLVSLLDKQEISYIEVKQMNHERSMLEEKLASLNTERDTLQAQVWEEEKVMCKKIADVEKQVREYNESMRNLLIAVEKRDTVLETEIMFNPRTNIFSEMTNIDLTHTIKPAIAAIRTELSDALAIAGQTKREWLQSVKETTQIYNEHKEKIDTSEKQLERLEETYKVERDNMKKELQESISRVESIELKIHQMKTEGNKEVLESQQKVDKVTQEADMLREEQNEELNHLNDEICAMLDAVATHKVEITRMLEQMQEMSQAVKKAVEHDHDEINLDNLNQSLNSTI